MFHASILASIDNMYRAQTQAFVYLVPLDEKQYVATTSAVLSLLWVYQL